MPTFHFIIDESKFHYTKGWKIWTVCSISCIVIEDISSFQKLLHDLYRDLSYVHWFWELRRKYPHYTEDALHQRVEILNRISNLPLRAFVSFMDIDWTITDSSHIHKILLKETLKPIVRSYKTQYDMSLSCIYFEEVEWLRDIIKSLDISKIEDIDVDINIISKTDYDWLSFLPDYTLGALNDIIKWAVNDGRSIGDKVFSLISPRVVSIKFTNNNWTENFFHFRKDGKDEFYKMYWSLYKDYLCTGASC